VDLRIRTKDGRDLPSAWSRVRLSNNDMIFIGIDLTERVREEQERVLLAAAIEQSMDAMAIADVNGKIQYVNPAFESLNSCSREKVMGVDIASVLASDRRQKWCERRDSRRNRRRRPVERTSAAERGEGKIELDTTITPLRDSRGAIADYLIIERDVTRERELERHLAASRKMEIIGTLAGGIAHDLNNILNPVLISAEAVMAEIPEDSPLRPDIRSFSRQGSEGRIWSARSCPLPPGRRGGARPSGWAPL
jgi:PAS domain S-box-containing protein